MFAAIIFFLLKTRMATKRAVGARVSKLKYEIDFLFILIFRFKTTDNLPMTINYRFCRSQVRSKGISSTGRSSGR